MGRGKRNGNKKREAHVRFPFPLFLLFFDVFVDILYDGFFSQCVKGFEKFSDVVVESVGLEEFGRLGAGQIFGVAVALQAVDEKGCFRCHKAAPSG